MALDLTNPALAFLAGAALAAVITAIAMYRRSAAIREDALERSRSVLRGQVSQHLAPLVPEFPWEPADARFLGQPVDFVIFDGLSADDEIEIVLLEVKTGGARLTKREAAIRDAVEAGRVRFEVFRMES